MYNTRHKTKKFDTDDAEELAEYDEILNNPLCTIVSERKEKLKTEDYEGGELVHMEEHIVLVVTWDEKILA